MENIIKDEYKITIERITTSEYPAEEEILVEERHYTDKELEENHRYISHGDRSDPSRYMKKIYGKKDVIAKRTKEGKVYEQIIDATNFNINSIVSAINTPKITYDPSKV